MGGIFLLKFSTEMLIRTMKGTLTHNSFIDEVLFRLYKFLDEKTERPWFYTELKK